MTKTIAAKDVADLIKPGMTVFVQGSIGQPQSLMKALMGALEKTGEALDGVRFVSVLTPGLNHFAIGASAQSRLTTFFDYRELRQSYAGGEIDFVPSHYRDIVGYLNAIEKIDLALIQLSPANEKGICSAGLSADFAPDILPKCGAVIAELNRRMPQIADAPQIPLEQIDYTVDADYRLPQSTPPATNAHLDTIAAHVAGLVQDGDVLQYGVGRVPQLVLDKLHKKNDLGLHTGLMTPSVRPLIDGGVMTGERKTADRGKHMTGAAFGDDAFYDWVAGCADFAFRPVSYTHDCRTIAGIDNFVAINSALEVDLFGQANAEMSGGRQVSGSGGLVDFIRGARLSKNGRAIICLPATSNKGQRSNIVSQLSSVVSVSRNDMHYVVTEHGVACLVGKSVQERGDALIAIAAPEFRETLQSEWKALLER